jgi:hypothetical protein
MTILSLIPGADASHTAAETSEPPMISAGLTGQPALGMVHAVVPVLEPGEPVVALVPEWNNAGLPISGPPGRLDAHVHLVPVPSVQSGPACTALLAVEHVDPDRSLLVTTGDVRIHADLPAIVRSFAARGLDGGIVAAAAAGRPSRFYLRREPRTGLIVEVVHTPPISDLVDVGFYWFRRGADFFSAVMEMIRKDASVDGCFHLCPAYNQLILRQARIGATRIIPAHLVLAAPHRGANGSPGRHGATAGDPPC